MSICPDQERNAVFAEEAFIVDAQIFLHTLMEEKGISRADLARAMGVSRARVSQVFSDECKNFTMRLFARAMFALDEAPRLDCDHFATKAKTNLAQEREEAIQAAANVVPIWFDTNDDETDSEICLNANDNRLAGLRRKAA
ncbi:helix-turn-helix transcriptional regulator [Sphingobium sp. WTD-1]|uniref:helix-turn-helix domain-containing protein n=1 Tax=Sphingobium sp. WTD-1 TaxID=2979467 RepID=UPI0024DF0176|nr:helix-turn-helix transcriptional regulator [Sphingobium sp. WTD-1]WIA56297.1 helix-turn-helix transcriptional regulator [Sphingobium sp. WTD-1]